MTGSHRIDRECSRSRPLLPRTLDCRFSGFAPSWAVFPRLEGPQSTTLGGRHCCSTGLGALDECRSGAVHFPGGQVWSYTYA